MDLSCLVLHNVIHYTGNIIWYYITITNYSGRVMLILHPKIFMVSVIGSIKVKSDWWLPSNKV